MHEPEDDEGSRSEPYSSIDQAAVPPRCLELFDSVVLQDSHPGGLRSPTSPGPKAGAASRPLLD